MIRARFAAATTWDAAVTSPSRLITISSSKQSVALGCFCRLSRSRVKTRSFRRRAVIATMQTSVLIVEDDLGIAELEKDRLEEAGHRTFLASDTDEAIRLVQENDIDLILLDYRLPGNEDGLQFFERIRE